MYSSHTTTIRLAQGTRLNGIFEIDAHIASGGMGEIYSGHAIETGDSVAIKVMRTETIAPDQRPDFLRRFLQEVRATARCAHPG